MCHIISRAQEGVGTDAIRNNSIRLELTDKEQHFAATLSMVDIALTHRTGNVGCALTLPMEKN